MRQHLQVIIVLDVTALQETHSSIDDSKLGVECAKYWTMEIDHFQIDVRDLVRRRQSDFVARPLFTINFEAVFQYLKPVSFDPDGNPSPIHIPASDLHDRTPSSSPPLSPVPQLSCSTPEYHW